MDSEESLPSPTGSPSPGAAFWAPARTELLSQLQDRAPELADLYEGSVRLLLALKFPGRVRFIAHGVREISNRLPDVIAGPRSGRLEYTGRMDQIAEAWERSGLGLDRSLPGSGTGPDDAGPPSPDVTVPRAVAALVAALVADHVAARTRSFDAAARLFEALDPENEALRDQLRPVINHWLEITRWFVKKVHQPNRIVHQDEQQLRSQFEQFESLLGSLLGGFFQTTDELDEILEDANA